MTGNSPLSAKWFKSGYIHYLQWLLLLSLLAVSATFGFYDLFSNFRQYDDEGYFLLITRLFLNGFPAYEQVVMPYGPVFLAVKSFLHDTLAVPLTNTATRHISLVFWIFLSACCGLLVRRLTSSYLAGFIGYALVFLFMRAFTNEPGHPHEWIAFCAVLIPLCMGGAEHTSNGWRWFWAGVLVSLIFNSKFNIGIYCLAAVMVVLAAGLPTSRWTRSLRLLSVVLAACIPFVLMWPHRQQINCLPYAAICSAAISAASIYAGFTRIGRATGLKDFVGFGTGFLFLMSAAFLFLSVNGSSLSAYIVGIQTVTASFSETFFFREYSSVQVAVALIAPLLAAVLLLPVPQRLALILCGKIVFASVTTGLLFKLGPDNTQTLLGWTGPWCWLCMAPFEEVKFSTARKLLALLAVFHLLLAYPIPGSQLFFGTFLVLVSALVCAADSIRYFAQKWQGQGKGGWLPDGNFVSFLIVAGLLTWFGYSGLELRGRYRSLEPVGIPGMEWLRLEPGRVRAYRQLIAEMHQADVGFIDSGLNSLYLWSGVNMAAPVVVQHVLSRVSRRQREEIAEGLAAAGNPLVLLRMAQYGLPPQKIDLTDWINSEFVEYRKIGGYRLMKKPIAP